MNATINQKCLGRITISFLKGSKYDGEDIPREIKSIAYKRGPVFLLLL